MGSEQSQGTEKRLKVKEIEEMTGIPNRSLITYINTYKRFIDYEMRGRIYYVHKDSIDVLVRIRDLYNQNLSKEQIEQYLASSSPAFIKIPEEENGLTVPLGKSIGEMKSLLQENRDFLKEVLTQLAEEKSKWQAKEEEHQKEVQELKKEIQQLRYYQHQKLETINQTVATIEKHVDQKQKGFWSWLSRLK